MHAVQTGTRLRAAEGVAAGDGWPGWQVATEVDATLRVRDLLLRHWPMVLRVLCYGTGALLVSLASLYQAPRGNALGYGLIALTALALDDFRCRRLVPGFRAPRPEVRLLCFVALALSIALVTVALPPAARHSY